MQADKGILWSELSDYHLDFNFGSLNEDFEQSQKSDTSEFLTPIRAQKPSREPSSGQMKDTPEKTSRVSREFPCLFSSSSEELLNRVLNFDEKEEPKKPFQEEVPLIEDCWEQKPNVPRS